MPQVTKGGKYIFGWSLIRDDLKVQLPEMAVKEYCITIDKNVYISSGSKSTGGFIVMRKGLLSGSKIENILTDNPALNDYTLPQGEFIKYKGRFYSWLPISDDGCIKLTGNMMDVLQLHAGDKLLSIRSSNIAFTMGVKGQLIERANNFKGEIQVY